MQRKLLARQEPKRTKTVLYAYRVLLTGVHLLCTGEVEANLPRLAHESRRPYLLDLIAQKREEHGPAVGLDWAFHDRELQTLDKVQKQGATPWTLRASSKGARASAEVVAQPHTPSRQVAGVVGVLRERGITRITVEVKK